MAPSKSPVAKAAVRKGKSAPLSTQKSPSKATSKGTSVKSVSTKGNSIKQRLDAIKKTFSKKLVGTPTQPCPLETPKIYGSSIKLDGDEKFRKETIKALDDIKKTPTGKDLLGSIEKSGKTVTIKPTTGGNTCSCSNSNCFANADGTPGKGTGSTIEFNPDRKKIGDQKWETRPPAIGLAHELIHAEHGATGTMARGDAPNDNKPDPTDPTKIQQYKREEVGTVGVLAKDNPAYTENKIRSEWDPHQVERKWY